MVDTAVAVAAALVGLGFAMSSFERWLEGGPERPRHQLAWTLALVLFTLAAAALATGAAVGWRSLTFRLFYLFGAILNVAFLALGTLYLLGGRRVGDRAAVVVGLGGAFAAGVVLSAPFLHALPSSRLAQGSEVFGALPRVLAGLFSGLGSAVVLGGAVWSAVGYLGRRRDAPGARRMLVANLLIALGTLVSGASGLLNSAVGAMTAFAVTLTVGIAIIFAGFLVAGARPGAVEPATSARLRVVAPAAPVSGTGDGAASR